MTPKPKTVLFSNVYTLKGGKLSPLFKSQSELAKLIYGKTESYDSVTSLQNFLSQALKANDEKGVKSLPVSLKSIILEIIDERLGNFAGSHVIKKEIDAAFDYWKANKTDHDLKGDEIFIETIKSYLDTSKALVLFLPRPIIATNRLEKNLLNDFYSLIDPYTVSESGKRIYLFFPSTGAAKAFWDMNLMRMSMHGAFDYDYGNSIFSGLNDKGLIRTFVTAPEHCCSPLIAFITNGQLDRMAEADHIISFSIETPYEIHHIRYSPQDTRYILENKLRPILLNEGDRYGIGEYIYKREW